MMNCTVSGDSPANPSSGSPTFSPRVIEARRASDWKRTPIFCRIRLSSSSPAVAISTPVDKHPSRGGPLETDHVFQQSGLPAAAHPYDAEDLAPEYFEADVFQNRLFAETCGETFQYDDRCTLSFFPSVCNRFRFLHPPNPHTGELRQTPNPRSRSEGWTSPLPMSLRRPPPPLRP